MTGCVDKMPVLDGVLLHAKASSGCLPARQHKTVGINQVSLQVWPDVWNRIDLDAKGDHSRTYIESIKNS